jgi:hypothetical protein
MLRPAGSLPNPLAPLRAPRSAPGTSPAIRPQWLKFIGAFFNREGVASNSADTRMVRTQPPGQQPAMRQSCATPRCSTIPFADLLTAYCTPAARCTFAGKAWMREFDTLRN